MPWSLERSIEIAKYADREGMAAAIKEFGLKHETIRRAKRQVRKTIDESEPQPEMDPSVDRILREIADRYNADELKAIAKGGKSYSTETVTVDAGWFDGDTIKFGVITDTHIGSKFFREDWFEGAADRMHAEDVDFICHVGDVTEGMSNRPGHMYELTHLGYTEQKQAAIEQLQKLPEVPLYVIDGNHDRWFIKSTGAKIVPDICDAIGATFLGHDTGEIMVNGVKIQLWHGEDGSSYAHSYRLQKVIEALPGGGKPNVLLAGHVHKMGYFFERNIHAISGGCLQAQTPWMRGKRLAAHTGFWIIEMDINNGIVRFSPDFYPYY